MIEGQWTENHNIGMTVADEYEAIKRRCDLERAKKSELTKYAPPENDQIQPYNSPQDIASYIIRVVAPPIVAIVSVGAFIGVIVAVAVGSVAAIFAATFAFVTANAGCIIGGLLGLGALSGVISKAFGGGASANQGGGDGNHYHYHQNNYQGPGGQQNNSK